MPGGGASTDRDPADGQPRWTGPVAAAWVLGALLRELRERRGLTLAQAAPLCRASTSKLSSLERGRRRPLPQDVSDLLSAYKADEATRADAVIWMTMVRAGPDADAHLDVEPGWQRRLTLFTAAATRAEHWAGVVLPPPLQTGRYARALADALLLPEPQRSGYVRQRARRAGLMAQEPGGTTVLLDESVLHRPVGAAEVMVEQLMHLRHFAARGVDVRIVPAAGALTVPPTAITRLVFGPPGPDDVVCLESGTSAFYLTSTADTVPHQEALRRLARHAVGHDAGVRLVDEAIRLHQERLPDGPGDSR
ncbi:Scr1 family TA system antitoxin-like transcriptional regulator [Kitasatospora sp. NPDC088783]|uniref:Scr1 family TA system antitoxin-like transcriptional regulator n=1 Tax=Kitasatospora sp. NPDC088783 TaxID=3364077 RepID=UPI0038020EBC